MKYYTYDESKHFLKRFSIKSSYEFYNIVKSKSLSDFLPKRPYNFYKNRGDWISWEDFLSFSKRDDKNNKYLKFEEAKIIINRIGLKGQKQWVKYHKDNNLSNLKIPSNPNIIYKNTGWVSMSDWLGLNTYKNIKNINYLKYEDCKKYLIENYPEIRNRQNWLKFNKLKLPIFIPKRPDYFYKKTNDWINWESFLNSEISPRSKSKNFLSFEEAKNFVFSKKFTQQTEYLNFIENNIDFLPRRPDVVYKKYWIGYADFLGCELNRTSFGERKIKEYLDENNIKYEREKSFESCKNKNKLRFDFYLIDYNMCIEYDGELHYKSIKLFGGDDRLKTQQNNDLIKNIWCGENGVRLLRISYKKKGKIFNTLGTILFK